MLVLIVFFGIGLLITFKVFIRFLFAVIVIGFTASAYGTFLSILFTQPETAVQISPMLMMPLIVLGGFVTNVG